MHDTIKQLLANQYEAALCALSFPVNECPTDQWHQPVANHKFCQAAFHALINTDMFLNGRIETQKAQPFHVENADIFRDYEEFEDRIPVLTYEMEFITQYLAHCRAKAAQTIADETAESLVADAPFAHLPFSRTEMHLHTIRHLQHHAAQLSLKLRQTGDPNIPWAKSGWREA